MFGSQGGGDGRRAVSAHQQIVLAVQLPLLHGWPEDDGTVVAVRARNGELHFDGDDVEKILEKLDSDNKAVL